MAEEDATALYKQIAATIRAEITAGTYDAEPDGPEKPLPGEKALAERFETSSATTRKALQVLEREGLIEIRRGVGPFLRRRKPILRNTSERLSVSQWGNGKAIWQADLGDHYPVPETEVFHSGDKGAPVVPDLVSEKLPAATYLIRDRRYTVDGAPVQIATSFFDAAVVKDTRIEKRDSGPGGVFNRLRELGYEVTFPEGEYFRARMPTDEEARRLKITTDKPVVEIVRVAATPEGQVLEVNLMVLVADAYVFQNQVTT